MNVLILTTKLPWPARDGGAIATLNMATGLANQGCRVSLLAMNTSKHYFPHEQIPASLKEKINILTVNVNTKISLPALLMNFLFSRYPYNARRFISDEFTNRLKELLIQESFDLIQLDGPYTAYCIPLVRNSTPAKICLRAHNLEHRIWQRSATREKNIFKKLYYRSLSGRIRKLEEKVLRQVDFVLPIACTDRQGLIEMGCKVPMHVTPTGFEISEYQSEGNQKDISLFFIGALDWGPNQEGLDWFFDRVWHRVLERWPETKIHVAGRNPDYYFKKNEIRPNTIIHGELEDALEFMKDHSIMLVPLLSGSGIRIKILEGMAMEKLIITTSVGAEGLDAQNGRDLFIADKPEDFIKVLEEIHDNPRLLQDTGLSARNFVTEKFDNLAISSELLKFIKDQMT